MGVRMPVESMSMRPLIGIVQLLEKPVIFVAQRLVQLRDQLVGRHALPPLRCGLEIDHRLDHLERRGVGGAFPRVRPWRRRSPLPGKPIRILSCS